MTLFQFFQFYADCGLEKFMIDISVKYFTIRGFMGNLVVLGFFIDKMINDSSYQRAIIKQINIANFSSTKADWRNVGLYAGTFRANFYPDAD